MKKTNYLTKTKFKVGLTCPRQLYYLNNKSKYADKMIDDPFLEALAKGGFQVGEYANNMMKLEKGFDAYMIDTLDAEKALSQTDALLKKDQVIIYEPAFLFDNCFVRCDILVKNFNRIEIYEVKSKSFAHNACHDVMNNINLWNDYKIEKPRNSYDGILNKQKAFKNGPEWFIKKEYQEYIYDIAFQAWVVNQVLTDYNINYYMYTPSKNLEASVNGLNQKFLIKEENGMNKVIVRGKITKKSLGESILKKHNVNWVVNAIHNNEIKNISNFNEFIYSLVEICSENIKGQKNISSACKACRFSSNAKGIENNGFYQCMSEETETSIEVIASKANVFQVWSNPDASWQVKSGKFFMEELETVDINYNDLAPLKRKDRQNIQILCEKFQNNKEFLNKKGLTKAIEDFEYPLHFIDFETSMTAIPYRKGQTPYQMIFFQFSHHILEKDGTIRHAGQYINLEPFVNPNISATRALYQQLKNDNGTIFRWSMHENTVLRKVYDELSLMSNEECNDREELMKFINEITRGGDREMQDMWQLYKNFHYLPETKGSNSIKYVLPSVLNRFTSMQDFLSDEVYGKKRLIESLNFTKMAWIEKDENGNVMDPYNKLPKVYKDYDREQLDLLYSENDLKNGGAAMTAYAVCQFTQISMGERKRLETALLRYCELDTFAMVIIWMYWLEQLGQVEIESLKEEAFA